MRTLLRHKADFAAIHAKMKAIINDADENNRGVLSPDAALELDHLKQRHAEVSEAIERRKLLLAEDDALNQREDAGATGSGAMMFADGRMPRGPAWRSGDGGPSAGRDDYGGFSSLGEMLHSLYRKQANIGFDNRLERLRIGAAGLRESVPSEGGFLVPDAFVVRLYEPGMGSAPLLDNADRVPMTTATVKIPIFRSTDHSATSPYGLAWSVVEEDGAFAEQGLNLGQLQLNAKKLGAIVYASNEWFADSEQAMRARLEAIFITSLRHKIESLLWNGTGAGQPLGVLNSAATLTIAAESGQGDTLLTENIVALWSRLLPGSHDRAIWVCNQTALPQLHTLHLSIGTGGANVSLLQPSGIAGGPSMSILGRPLYISEHLPVLGTSGDIVLIDPTLYVLGDRQAVTVDTSSHVAFGTDRTAFRIKWRGDGQPSLSTTFAPENGSALAFAVKISSTRT